MGWDGSRGWPKRLVDLFLRWGVGGESGEDGGGFALGFVKGVERGERGWWGEKWGGEFQGV